MQSSLYNVKIYSLRSRGIHLNHKQKQRMLCSWMTRIVCMSSIDWKEI